MLLLFSAAVAAHQLVALDRRIQAAMVANKAPTLRRHIAKEFRFTHADGSIETKADVLQTAASTPRYYLRRQVIDATAELHGRFGLVFGRLDVASGATSKDPSAKTAVCYVLNYVHVYEMREGRWQLLSHRTTGMTQPERPCASDR